MFSKYLLFQNKPNFILLREILNLHFPGFNRSEKRNVIPGAGFIPLSLPFPALISTTHFTQQIISLRTTGRTGSEKIMYIAVYDFLLTSGTITKAVKMMEVTKFTQKSHRKNVK